ncbi:hypothetical protein RI129_010114 [Pyrocoelia pectoralis]|uniref:Ketimine reductase mu-crystallin n=1 Tax=Pyrocoelia pectoralis TaxID=417401 RepID=A0AAN7ZFI2_9COLE
MVNISYFYDAKVTEAIIYEMCEEIVQYESDEFTHNEDNNNMQKMSCPYEYLTDHRIEELLTWEKAYEAAERALERFATGEAHQSERLKVPVGPNFLFTMCGYLKDEEYGGLVSLLFTQFISNKKLEPPLPVVHSDITLMDEKTGVTKVIVPGRELVNWVLPSVSVMATRHLHGKTGEVLAIIGAGNQGRLHAIALHKFFNFSEVRVWNRTASKAEDLVKQLNKAMTSSVFVTANFVEECVNNADVIVTATKASQTLVKYSWIKKGAHINAIGVSVVTTELDDETYRSSTTYTDNKEAAEIELKPIVKLGVKFKEVGDVIVGKIQAPKKSDTTIFQSSGTAIQYCAFARLISDLHKGKQ